MTEQEVKIIFRCKGCGVDTNANHEYYMLKDKVWFQVMGKKRGMLCISCVEKKLGRELNRSDFTDCPLNLDIFRKSDILRDRLTKIK